MLMLQSKKMREQRAKLIADSRDLLKGDTLTAEIRAKVEALDKDIDQMTADIELYERQETRERELATKSDPINSDPTPEDRKKKNAEEARKYSEAFEAWFRFGAENLTSEQRATLRSGYREDKNDGKESRIAQTITTTGGGYSIAQGFMPELERSQLAFGGVRQASRILTTSGGNPIPWPTVDDTANTGEDSAINTSAVNVDMEVTFGSVTLSAYKMDSGIILVPNELLEDTSLPLETEIGSLIGERLGRRQNVVHTSGLGVTTFQGVTVGASAGLTTASATAIAADELIDFQHKVDPAYRDNPKCAWMMNDDTMRLIRKLKDAVLGRYLLDYSTIPGMFTTLLGKKVITNQQMDTVAAGKVSVLFGDFNKNIIRDVRGIVVRRLNELYATADQTAFIAWYRGDSRVVSASTKALVKMTQHA